MADTMTPEQQVAALKVQLDAATKLASERKDELDAAAAERDSANGKIKTLEERIGALETKLAAGATAMETAAIKQHADRADAAETKLAELAATREADIRRAAELRIKAAAVMGSDFRVDGSTDIDLMSVVIKKFSPKEDLTGKSAAFVASRFDSLVDAYMANARSLTRAGEVLAREVDVEGQRARSDSNTRETRARTWHAQASNPKAFRTAFGGPDKEA